MRPGRILSALPCLLVAAALTSCTDGGDGRRRAHDEVLRIVENHFEAYLELNPVFATSIGDHRYDDRFANDIGPEYRRRSLELEQRSLQAIRAVDPSLLEGQDLLSREVFIRERERSIEAYRHPSHLVPVNQFYSTPNQFAQLGSGGSYQPFATVGDYDAFLARMRGFPVWVDQAIDNMREGIARGIVQPRVLMERVLPQLASQIVDDPAGSIFDRPIKEMPAAFPAAERGRLDAAYRAAILDLLVPAYRRLHDFIRDDYLPRCRDSVGLAALPGGDAWYAFLARTSTTTDLTPDAIHRIGLEEVERIRAAMDALRREVGFQGDLTAFFASLQRDARFQFGERERMLEGYRAIGARVDAALPRLFDIMPTVGFEIRPVEPFMERSSADAFYQAAPPDGSRPGVFYVNTYDLPSRPAWAMASTFLHEAQPGHHFQIAIQRGLRDLPRFRRFGFFGAYVEGWALYAESLGGELGMYDDPYQRFGALEAELWRAIRLVVDTGLHARGWSRKQVLDYMAANSPAAESRAIPEAERYIAIPGQALSYMIGRIRISALRRRGEEQLGDRFDIRAFHRAVLEDGQLPLDVLEVKIDRWIAARAR